MTRKEIIQLGFKKREDGFLGIMIERGVWLEINLKTKRTIIYSSDGKFIDLKYAKTTDRLKQIYNGLTGKELITK